MSGYKKVLAAVDLTDEAALIRDRALMLATQHGAELHLVHVLEPIVAGYAVEVMSVDLHSIQADVEKHARKALHDMGARFGIPEERLHTVIGQPAPEIRALAKKLGADLVVVGGHGKHGFELLLGSTSSGVAHGISCDLLILRMPDKKPA